MSVFPLLLKTYLKFYITTRRFVVIIPLYLLLSLLFPLLLVFGITSKPADVYTFTTNSLGNFSAATALVAALLAGDALSQDFGRQGLYTLTQPIRRAEVMLARYGSATLATVVVMVTTYLVPLFVFNEVFYQSLVPSVPEIVGLGLALITSMVAFVVLFSSLFRSSTISVVLAVVFIWIVMPSVSSVLSLAKVEPWFLLSYAGTAVQDVAAKTYPPLISEISGENFGFGRGAGPGFTVYNPAVQEAMAIMVGYLVVSLVLSWVVYSRRELKDTV